MGVSPTPLRVEAAPPTTIVPVNIFINHGALLQFPDHSVVLLQDLDKLFVKCLLDIYFRVRMYFGVL